MSVPPPARPYRVTVVDDEAAARDMVGDYLRMQGFDVTLCDGGRSLRAVLTSEVPDLVLLDLNMPEEDGLSLVRLIKQTSAAAVIMLTATAGSIDRVVGLEMGADDYGPKPCEWRELLARGRAGLRRAHWSAARPDERRLAAIASLDQVGFSRSVQTDEPGTLAAIDRVFTEVLDPGLSRHRGTLFKKTGAGALVEFASVVDAVEWGAAFQTALSDLPVASRRATPTFRLGLAVGDVVVAGTDRLGEAVALAVRVQETARPGTVTASDFTYRLAGSRTDLVFKDLGFRTLKNIAEPMRLWEWAPEE